MVLRFGPFELDTDREELRRSGLVLRLPRQPARLLLMLVRRAGEVVTREEIQQELWGSETHVDFEQGINAAIRQIRYHLGDNAEVPRYVKTIPRRGYVWIAPVEEASAAPPVTPPPPAVETPPPPKRRGNRLVPTVAAIIAVVAVAAVAIRLMPARGNARTIAVMPFRALGALPPGVDPAAFTEELRSTVAALPREHVMLLDERSGNGAQVRIEGTIQRADDTVRLIVAGIDTASGTQLWTETHERRIGEHHNMAVQTAHLVSYEVAKRFLPAPRHEPPLRTPVPERVAEVYRRARLERSRWLTDPERMRVEALLQEALRHEPRFPEALSGLADVWAYRAGSYNRQNRAHAVAKTRELATRALALQPDNAEARTALGLMALQYEWDLAAAEQAFREAIEDDPAYVDAHYNLAMVLSARGEHGEAFDAYAKAQDLDPIDYDLRPVEGMLYFRARRYEEAIAKYREILRFREPAVQARWGLLWAAARLGDWNETTSILRPMLELPPRPPGVRATQEECRDLFRRLEPVVLNTRQRGLFDDYQVAAYYSVRGDRDPALAALNRAVENRSPTMPYLLVDPRFDSLRADPRYARIAARIR